MNPHTCFRLCTAITIVIATFTTAGATQLDPEQPIDLELEQASLVETLQSFAGISGCRLDVDPDVEGSVTLALESTPWRQVLDRICVDHALNCELLAGEPPVLRVRSTHAATGAAARPGYAQAIDMSLKAADLRQTLQAFGMISGIEVIVDDAVTGTLTIEVQDTPWTVVLEEACHLSGCRLEWGASAVYVKPADPAAAGRQAPIAFDRAPVAQALATIAQTPFFGALGTPELELAAGLDGTVSLDLDGANWLEALNAVCRAAACRWQLTYGAPSRLAVRPEQKGLEAPVRLPAAATTLAEATAILAGRLDLEVDLDPGLDPRAAVHFTASESAWKDAVRDLCRQASCFWTVHEGRLVLNPRVEALAERPAAGAGHRRLHVRFFAPDASAPAEGTARFNWTTPVRSFESVAPASGTSSSRLGRDRDEHWLARLSWIPFGPELDLVMPMIVRCAAGSSRWQLLEPVRWPLGAPVTRQWRGAIVELSSAAGDDDGSPIGNPDCDRGTTAKPSRIRAAFRRAGAGAGAHQTELELESRPGTYLLVTPPGADQPKPAAAILALGTGTGGVDVALIRPDGDSEPRVTRRTVPAGGELSERIVASDGVEFELRLSPVD